MSRVVVVGSYNVGLTVVGPSLPKPGETVLGHTFDVGPGGKGSNQAIGARRLGADVTLVAKVGRDDFGHAARAFFRAEGLDGPGILESDTPTGAGVIIVDDDGHNMIAVAPGANAELIGDDLDRIDGIFAGAGYLLCQLEASPELFTAAASRARAAGARTVLNPAPAVPLDDETYAWVDILTPNETELATLAGTPVESADDIVSAARSLMARGVGEVIATLGQRGSMRVTADTVASFGAHRVKAVDTTGAGDAFNAGLVSGLASGLDVTAAIELGSRAGAFCVTKLGVIDGLATLEQLDIEVP
jgi:ribokinase